MDEQQDLREELRRIDAELELYQGQARLNRPPADARELGRMIKEAQDRRESIVARIKPD